MKRILSLAVCLVMALTAAFAQADKIVGMYDVDHDGVQSKVKISKMQNGKYRAQVTWVSNLKMEDGSIRTDVKNPDKSKRNVRADQIVLLENLEYDAKANVWNNGKIYDPVNGKIYKVEVSFKDDTTLKLRGYIGIPTIGRTVYWTKVK